MPETYCEQAIVLRRQAFRGYDSRISVYTRGRGKIDLLVRGAKRPSSKLAAHLEPITLVDLMVISGRMAYVGGSRSLDCFPNIKDDYEKLVVIGEVFNHLNRVLREQVSDEKIFDIVATFLNLLEQQSADSLWYNWLGEVCMYKVLDSLGYGLNLENCGKCHNKFLKGEMVQFSFNDHLLLCANCVLTLPVKNLHSLKNLDFLRTVLFQPLSATLVSAKRVDLETTTTFLHLRTKILISEIT